MATVTNEQVAALAQRGGEVETGDASARAAPLVAIAADNNGWAVESLQDARCDDADNADVPWHLAFDDDEIVLGFEFGMEIVDDLLGNIALDFLALAIAGIECLRQRRRGLQVGG